ncbi:DUF3267 domain-containing protein [Enterococcus sp. BWR-S5]|uniref:DUF3267 domain-containing protein n=1 Tax=Enterococcus sp. BWR-S5 TaxID=2787714 RepID=UPI0019218367|nr:DUF3267 domain-containing protein [Enterococcus sp. BWR-S5]MBL1226130.1 DUF3267 domain-containing protein [Enterococcus sp. BWR-S5]
MELIKKIDLIDNKALVRRLEKLSIPVTLVFLLVFSGIGMLIGDIQTKGVTTSGVIIMGVGLIGSILIHELIHGLFFKLFNLKGKVIFGFKQGVAYAASPDSIYSKEAFIWISLAPFVLITFGLIVALGLYIVTPFVFVVLSSFHGAACIGDFYWVYLVLTAPKDAVVKDTKEGIAFYRR